MSRGRLIPRGPFAFEARAECRPGWQPPEVEGVKIEVVERIYEALRLRFTASGLSERRALFAVRRAVDEPAFRRQCEVGPLSRAQPRR